MKLFAGLLGALVLAWGPGAVASTWVVTNDPVGGSGAATAIPGGYRLDDGLAEVCVDPECSNFPDFDDLTTLTTVADKDQVVSFTWSYVNQDVPAPSFEPVGYVINGVLTQIPTPNSGGPDDFPFLSSGSNSFSVKASDTFGFYIDVMDIAGVAGPASWSVFSPVFGVPEPPIWLVMLMGFGAVGAFMRCQRRASAAV